MQGVAPNIVLITIDTLRADALGSYGGPAAATPVLDGLAKQGVRFERAYATSSWTAPSMASLLTGVYPARHGVEHGTVIDGKLSGQPAIAEGLPRVAALLGQAGYRTYGVAANGHLQGDLGFAAGFDHYECLGFVAADRVTAALAAMKTEILGQPRPWFTWVHLLDPHAPYAVNEAWLGETWRGRPRFPELDNPPSADTYARLDVTGERLGYVRALYQGEVRRIDDVVGHLLAELQVDEHTLVVVTSDHGEDFGEHGRFGHGQTLFETSVRVPLIVRLPEHAHAGRVVTDAVSAIDLLPTLAAQLGVAPPASIDGVNLLPAMAGEPLRREAVFAEVALREHFRMVTSGGWKLIRRVPSTDQGSLYRLADDPGEQAQVHGSQPEVLARLQRLLAASAVMAAPGSTTVVPIGAARTAALEALGYVQ